MKIYIVTLFTCVCFQTLTFADSTNAPGNAAASSPVKINFAPDAQLSPAEVQQVLKLAKLCGIRSPAEVYTCRALPSTSKYVGVKGVEHVNGRNTTFDSVEISKLGWCSGGPEDGSVKIGNFWASADAKYSTWLRRYEFHQASIQIVMGDDVDVAFADKVIPLIDAGQVRFRDDSARQGFEELKSKTPDSFHKGEADRYELWFTGQIMIFEWKDNRLTVISINRYMI